MTNNTMSTQIQTWIAGLDDPDRTVRQRAAMALGTAGEAAAAEALVARLGTETDCFVREALTWATVQAGPAAVPGVLEQLGSPTPAVRMQAAHVLSKIGDPDHAGVLAGVVADPDPEVAVKAYRAAANTQAVSVVPALAGRLGHGDLEQRDALNAAFVTLGEKSLDALVAALGDADASVREHAADALGSLGSPLADPAVDPLRALLGDVDADVRFAAVTALGELDPESAEQAIADAAGSTDTRVSAVARRLQAR